MSGFLAAPSCVVEIYPFEGSPFVLTPGQIRGITVQKSIRGEGNASFNIQLSPGGPYGVESSPSWAEIITPMSFILIGMSRGIESAVVMVGVVTSAGGNEIWATSINEQGGGGSRAMRAQNIRGTDFSFFFNSFNYYALTFYGLTAGTPIGGALDYVPGPLASKFNEGLIGGNSSAQSNPVLVGKAWYNNVMAGTNGILAKTFVPYANNTRISFGDALTRTWEDYPDVFIPYSDFFMVNEESWSQKFRNIFPHPWYEWFVTTGPQNVYTPRQGSSVDTGGFFTMNSLPGAVPVGPVMVARVNPSPSFSIEQAGGLIPGSMDISRWNALPLYDLTQKSYNFTSSSFSFDAGSARNFYQINPINFSSILGNNSNNVPFVLLFIAGADPASIQRYGFRPYIGNTHWWFDPQGNAPQNKEINLQTTMLNLTGKMISWFHPQPLMMNALVELPLSPTILVGTRFRYQPFKDSLATWDFYIDGVSHSFVFGGDSRTTLELSRGLPTSAYDDTADDGLLRAIWTGNAMRDNGVYVIGLPDGTELALQIISTPDQATELSSHLATVFVTPQSGAS